jgi:hypothetical protein
VVIPCGPYLPHGAFMEFFTLSWAVERWNISSVSLLLSLLLKSIGENMIAMILWFLNIRHSGTLFGMWFLTSAQQMFLLILGSSTLGTRVLFLVCGSSPQLNKCSFSSYHLKAKYVELMGKGKWYNSSHVYCQPKGWSEKS